MLKLNSFPRGVLLLFVNNLFMSLGFYALIPYLSLHVTRDLSLTAALAGAVLMVRQMSQQGPTFLTGMLADRMGYRLLLCLGLAVRGVGFSMFAFVTTPFWLFVAAFVSGLGGALFSPTGRASLMVLSPEAERVRFYSLDKVMSNVGMIGAALVGALLIHYDFAVLSLICGGIYLVLAVVTYWRLPDVKVQEEPVPFRKMWSTVLADRTFLQVVAVGIGFWFMYMQLFLTLPLYVVELTGRQEAISAINLVLAALVIAFQYKVTQIVSRYHLHVATVVGLVLMAVALLVIGHNSHLVVLLIAFTLFVLGIMIVDPSFYELTSRYAKPEMQATYFGFSSLAMGIGGGLSQGAGGYLLDLGKSMGMPALLWWVCLGVGLISGWGMYRLYRQTKAQAAIVQNATRQISS